jgi:hypothetical protein
MSGIRLAFWLASTAALVLSLFLAACSYDPVQPAPVYMMGSAKPMDPHSVLMSAPQAAAPSIESRPAMAAPIASVQRAAPQPSNRTKIAGNHSTRAVALHAYHAVPHRVALRKRPASKSAGAAAKALANTEANIIPLDERAPVAGPESVPSQTRASAWVSPEPTEPANNELRPQDPERPGAKRWSRLTIR